MVLVCADCGFKSPQGSEFCGSCGKETEFGIKERQSREREEAKAAREREEAKAAAAERAPKTIFQKVRYGIAKVLLVLTVLAVFTSVGLAIGFDGFPQSRSDALYALGLGVVCFLAASLIMPTIYQDTL